MNSNTINKIRNLDYKGLWLTIRFYLIVFLILFLILGFFLGYFGIAIIPNTEYESSLLWLLLNSFIYGIFFSFCGFFNKGIRKEFKKYVFVLFLFLLLFGFGFADIEFHINLRLPLWYPTFSTSTLAGILFFVSPLNTAMFLGIFALSFTIESEQE